MEISERIAPVSSPLTQPLLVAWAADIPARSRSATIESVESGLTSATPGLSRANTVSSLTQRTGLPYPGIVAIESAVQLELLLGLLSRQLHRSLCATLVSKSLIFVSSIGWVPPRSRVSETGRPGH